MCAHPPPCTLTISTRDCKCWQAYVDVYACACGPSSSVVFFFFSWPSFSSCYSLSCFFVLLFSFSFVLIFFFLSSVLSSCFFAGVGFYFLLCSSFSVLKLSSMPSFSCVFVPFCSFLSCHYIYIYTFWCCPLFDCLSHPHPGLGLRCTLGEVCTKVFTRARVDRELPFFCSRAKDHGGIAINTAGCPRL